MDILGIKPDYDLNIMKDRQTLIDITVRGLEGLDGVMKEAQPDLVLVHGDTTTTFIASLAALYNQIPIGHVEAGLRTWNKYSPFPEEVNRQLTGVLADLHFAPTSKSAQNLRDTTERPEGLKLAGTDEETIFTLADELLSNKEAHDRMAHASNPYGDGHASERIVQAIIKYFDV